jgi:hypothetical protein
MTRFPAARIASLLRRAALAVLALAVTAAPAHAQRRYGRSVLLVTVTDEAGKPVQRAYVTVAGTEYGDLTDAQGQARVTGIAEGGRLVQVSRQGFAFGRVAAEFSGHDTVRAAVKLTPQPIELAGVTATSWGRSMRLRQNGFYQRMRAGLGAFMARDRIDQLQPYRTTDIFRYMRGFMVVPAGHGARWMVVSSRGPVSLSTRACVPKVYVDGMLTAPTAADQADILELVPPQDLEAVEAYSGAATIPAEYNPTGSACGVILLWTRDGN